MCVNTIHKLTISYIFILIPMLASAQNIYSALHLNEERDYKGARPKKITETTTFYGNRGNSKNKSVKKFDNAGMLVTEERFDDDNKLNLRLARINDTTNRLILSSTAESWTILGLQKHVITYQYNNQHFLVQIIYQNIAGNVFEHYEIANNERGNPVEISGFAADGSPYGKETATYLYDKNKVITSVIKPDGTILNTDTSTINFKKNIIMPDEGMTFNPQGDLVNWIRKDYKGNKTFFEATLTYDSRGNCINETTYEISTKSNGEHKKQLYSDKKREYTY